MAQKLLYKYAESIKTRLFRIGIFQYVLVSWLILATVILYINTNNLTTLETIQIIFATALASYFYLFHVQYFKRDNLVLFPDFMKIICLSLLILILGYWSIIAYAVFYLVILANNAFSDKRYTFFITLGIIIADLILILMFQNDLVFRDMIVRQTVFVSLFCFIIAFGIVSRIFARESLNVDKQEKNLVISLDSLRRERNETVALLDKMENAIISLDRNNDINFVNKSALNIFPIFRGKLDSKVSIEKIFLVDTSGRQITLKEIVENSDKTLYRNDLTIITKGKPLNFNVLVTKIFDDNKKYQGAMVSIHNLTADEMLEKDKVEFASLASHEIRTPLTVIEGYLYLMLFNKDFEYNDLTKEYLTMLHSSTTDLIKLANDILSMSKIDEGSIRVNIETAYLSRLIKETVSEQIKFAELKGLSIDYRLDKVPNIETDQIKVREILRNLIGNAIKFSVKGKILIQLDQEGKEIVISVEDSGIGIPESSKDKIFNKFYQVENWETRKNSGSGLGLYVSKSLAKRIGGDLVLEETTKKGSRFSLILPIKYPHPEDLKKHEEHELKEFIKGF